MSVHVASVWEALALLVEGNRRFAGGRCEHPNTDLEHVTRMSTENQRPFAAVLTCADSRVPVERVFDRGVGDLFVVRVAGNVCGVSAGASLEFAVTALGCRLVVVLGHSQCGAVTAACAPERQSDAVERLLTPIRETARRVRDRAGEDALVERVIRENVTRSIRDFERTSRTVSERRRDGRLVVVPAVYDLATGVVEWLDARASGPVEWSADVQVRRDARAREHAARPGPRDQA